MLAPRREVGIPALLSRVGDGIERFHQVDEVLALGPLRGRRVDGVVRGVERRLGVGELGEQQPVQLEPLAGGIPCLGHVPVEDGEERAVLVCDEVVGVEIAMTQGRSRGVGDFAGELTDRGARPVQRRHVEDSVLRAPTADLLQPVVDVVGPRAKRRRRSVEP